LRPDTTSFLSIVSKSKVRNSESHESNGRNYTIFRSFAFRTQSIGEFTNYLEKPTCRKKTPQIPVETSIFFQTDMITENMPIRQEKYVGFSTLFA